MTSKKTGLKLLLCKAYDERPAPVAGYKFSNKKNCNCMGVSGQNCS
jgi:hypothetical protein